MEKEPDVRRLNADKPSRLPAEYAQGLCGCCLALLVGVFEQVGAQRGIVGETRRAFEGLARVGHLTGGGWLRSVGQYRGRESFDTVGELTHFETQSTIRTHIIP